MIWLAIRATEDDVRAALRGGGVEVIGEGGVEALGVFLEGAESLEEPWAMVWLKSDPLIRVLGSWDTFTVLAEGGEPVTIASDSRLVSSLIDMVTARVAEEGGCLLDLREFGLSTQTVRLVADRAGLSVSFGLKAVFTGDAPRTSQKP